VGYASKKNIIGIPKNYLGEGRKEGRQLKAVLQDTGHLLKVALQLYLLDLTYIRSQQACCALYMYIYIICIP
jgi:hypothetical protein